MLKYVSAPFADIAISKSSMNINTDLGTGIGVSLLVQDRPHRRGPRCPPAQAGSVTRTVEKLLKEHYLHSTHIAASFPKDLEAQYQI